MQPLPTALSNTAARHPHRHVITRRLKRATETKDPHYCPERPEETIHHALLACSAFAAERAALWARMEQEVGLPAADAARALPADRQLAALLGDAFWGDRAQAVPGWHRPAVLGCADAAAAVAGAVGGCGGGGGGW